jgi:hypothetical protein
MKLFPIRDLDKVAATKRPGYADRINRFEVVDGFFRIPDDEYVKMRGENWDLPRPQGLGDAIHKIAGPIGRAIGWPCVKKDGSTDLIPGSPCAKWRDDLNTIKLTGDSQ